MAITKAEMIDKIHIDHGISRKDAKQLVEIFFELQKNALAEGHEIKLSGFGRYELSDKKARPGRNPKTGDPKLVSERRVVTFRTGQKLKARLEQKSTVGS